MDFQILGIGPLEVVFFVVLLLLLFGPKDLARMAREIGKFINRVSRSERYQAVQQASREIRTLPQRIVEEAQLDEVRQVQNTIRQDVREASAMSDNAVRAWTQEIPAQPSPVPPPESPPPDPPAAT
jgi:Sec-independent protein translocase protein TatA